MTRTPLPPPVKTFETTLERGTPGLIRAGIAIVLAFWTVFFLFSIVAKADPILGYVKMCSASPEMCPDVDPVVLKHTNDLRFMLSDVRRQTDFEMVYEPDGETDVWERPREREGNLYGDCEDEAVHIRDLLLARGIPMGAIRFMAGLTPNGTHAFLRILTDDGDLFMDRSQVSRPQDFHATPLLMETFDCSPHIGCKWRINTLYQSHESRVAHLQDGSGE